MSDQNDPVKKAIKSCSTLFKACNEMNVGYFKIAGESDDGDIIQCVIVCTDPEWSQKIVDFAEKTCQE